MPKDSIFNVISINHDIISSFINIYVSAPRKKARQGYDERERARDAGRLFFNS